MSMRTPFGTISGLGSAKEGTTHFWHQRLTALANVPLTLFFVWFVIQVGGKEAAEIVVLLGNPLVAGLMVLTLFSVSWHMRLGLQVVIEDYVHTEGLKIFAVTANNFISLGAGALGIVAVLKLSFGG